VSKQCELAGVSRSSWYYQPQRENAENLALMKRLDRLYTRWPFYGVRRMTLELYNQDYQVNAKRIRRLIRLMGLEAIYPKPRLSCNGTSHPRYPYLLKAMAIQFSNQVWCADITYVGIENGFVYLFAVMDWFSRYVLEWGLSRRAVLVQIDFFVFETAPEPFDEDVVEDSSAAIHADGDLFLG
jgi:putative transposase